MTETILPPSLYPNLEDTAKRLKAGGTNSRRVGDEKAFKALHWVYRWGWSYPFLLDLVASPKRRGLTKKLVEKKLLASYPSPGAGGQKGVPNYVVSLTRDGQMIVEGLITEDQLLDQKHDDEIPWHQLRHDALVQRATATSENVLSFYTPKEIAARSAPGVKQPDAIWEVEGVGRMGIELELTNKKVGREINQTLLALVESVKTGNPHDLTRIAMMSHSQAILDKYKRKLTPGATISLWEKDESKRWKESKDTFQVPSWSIDRFMFKKIDL